MPFYKKCSKLECVQKYGSEQHFGYFAQELIKKGDLVFACMPNECKYLNSNTGEMAIKKTKHDLLSLMQEKPYLNEFLKKYAYMIDDDTFSWPKDYGDKQEPCQCSYFNHSCVPNLGCDENDTNNRVAIRDIECGEEVTISYSFFDTESSLDPFEVCKCGAKEGKCSGRLRYDQYRNVDWQKEYYKYCTQYVRKRIDEINGAKWFSTRCFLKYYTNENERMELGLTSLENLDKNELVAVYGLGLTEKNMHYIRHNEKSTCVIEGNQVFTLDCVTANTELTLKFFK
jgi:hypothetical protein